MEGKGGGGGWVGKTGKGGKGGGGNGSGNLSPSTWIQAMCSIPMGGGGSRRGTCYREVIGRRKGRNELTEGEFCSVKH